jgi:SAM-dependent methyltransferase
MTALNMLSARTSLRSAYYLCRGLFYLGQRHSCPVCGWGCRSFLPYHGECHRTGAVCPRCGALERHRFLWLYLLRHGGLERRNLRVLHIAPEPCLRRKFARLTNLDYHCLDMAAEREEEWGDVTRLAFPDGSFDLVICSHVLEHVEDDEMAVRQIARVLDDAGQVVLQVPLDRDRTVTFEDPTITAPEARRVAFGQSDHVRVYGRDFAGRFSGVSLKIGEIAPDEYLCAEAGLGSSAAGSDALFVCRHSARP